MPQRRFADEADIVVEAGCGGAGCVSFQRRRFQPRGAPDGGDGGDGGDVILVACSSLRTLANFRHQRHFRAPKGESGRGQLKKGAHGANLEIPVPPGTMVLDAGSGQLLADLVKVPDTVVVAQGGRGGKGNAHFGSSRLRSPRFAQSGEPGQQRQLRLELHLLADVGLIGSPNAGKTTLLAGLTASKAHGSSHPFSTLEPNLGVIQHEEHDSIIVADIPGLITGAHLGKGLGDRFLRHVQRTRLLLQVVDASVLDPTAPCAPVELIRKELGTYDPQLLLKKYLVVLNKIDLLSQDFPLPAVIAALQRCGWPCLALSALTGQGVARLKEMIWCQLETLSDVAA
ncbi:Obg family GTPase CgtA [Desulfobacca acetoxidans]|nr:GTPase ObgE [Desulfobacterales bacterium]